MPNFVSPIFGNWTDSDFVATSTTDTPIDASGSGTHLTKTFSATNAAFAVGQKVLIHQTQGTPGGATGAVCGARQVNYITGYTAGVVTLAHDLDYDFGGGGSAAQIIVIKQYRSFTVNTGITFTCKPWNGTTGGIMTWACSGKSLINGTLNLNGAGFRGGSSGIFNNWNMSGEGTGGASTGNPGLSGAPQGNGGGGGKDNVGNESGGGGGGGNRNNGGGGSSPQGQSGSGGNAVGQADQLVINLGGGGGAGGANNNPSWVVGGTGGVGGGILIAWSGEWNSSSGSVLLNGTTGGNCVSNGSKSSGAGGGGAGGAGVVYSKKATFGTVSYSGAAGGGTTNPGGTGGDGWFRAESGYVSGLVQANALINQGGQKWQGSIGRG